MPIKVKRTPQQPTEELQDKEPIFGTDSFVDDTDRIIQKYRGRITGPITAIRSHCVTCMGGAVKEIAKCTAHDCSLYTFRMGVNILDARSVKARAAKDQ